jgi:2-polyprenyl-3-methyl-5-hydroxy-6-metoxy-1,4-benzoquinol methylase
LTTEPEAESAFLDKVAGTYVTSESAQDRLIRKLVVRTFAPFLRGRALELGCSDGYMTELLCRRVERLDVVEGSAHFLELARRRSLPNVRFFPSLFEDFAPAPVYDAVVAAFVLEHVRDVAAVLRTARRALKPGGLLLVAVPNARALSRQLARHMGLLDDLADFTANDRNHGHRRVYDRARLNRDLERAGFEIIAQGGILLKPLADFQMDRLIDAGILGEEQLEGLYKLGLEYPDLCGTLFSISQAPAEQPNNHPTKQPPNRAAAVSLSC